MKVKFYLRDPKKNGTTAIYVSICYHNQRLILFPGESIQTGDWNNKNGKNEPKASAKNAPLIGRLFKAEQLYRDTYDELKISGGIVPPEIFKQAIAAKINPALIKDMNAPVLITAFFDTLISDSKSGERLGQNKTRMNLSSIKPFLSTKNQFISFEEKQKKQYCLTDISQKLIDDFIKFLNVHQKLSVNGSAKYLTTFKLLMKYAAEKKLISNRAILETKVDIRREKSDNIYLTEAEIDKMMKLTGFSTTLYETVRDLFIIGCKTGLRFSDYSNLRLGNINNGFINVTQRKTGGKVTIPVHPIVKQILLKYPKGLPQCPPNQVFNRYLKEIGKQLPELDTEFEKKITRSHKVERTTYKKWQLLQSHSARRSFCTNEYLNGTTVLTIMSISGHLTQKAFMTYIKATSQEHAQLLKKEWERRGE